MYFISSFRPPKNGRRDTSWVGFKGGTPASPNIVKIAEGIYSWARSTRKNNRANKTADSVVVLQLVVSLILGNRLSVSPTASPRIKKRRKSNGMEKWTRACRLDVLHDVHVK